MLVVFTVRPYKESDLKQLIELYQLAFSEPPWNETWTQEQVQEDLEFALQQESPIILVAEKTSLLGFAWGYSLPLEKFPFLSGITNNASYMDEIAVLSNKRTKGIGTLLGLEYLKIATPNFAEVILRTDERNTSSMTLFKKLGFYPVKIEENTIYDPEYPERIYLRRKLK